MNISWNGKWTKKVLYKVVDIGPIIRDKYSGSLHLFGDEILSDNNLPNGIVYIGPQKEDEYIEVVYNKDLLSENDIIEFLNKYKILFCQ